MNIFIELSIVIFIATVISIILRALKQPLIVGYIFTGILAGPYFFNILTSHDTIEIFSKIGIIILLFIVGLNLNPNVVKEIGKTSLLIGFSQIFFTTFFGFIISIFLGFDKIASLYIAIALTLSSTIVVLKLLADKKDLNTLYAKVAIGLLIVQDIAATVILLVISSLKTGTDSNLFLVIFLTLLKGTAIIAIIIAASRLILNNIVNFAAQSQELLFLFSICWGLSMAAIFYVFGFSVEIGALVAGVTLAATPYAFEISSRLKPLRDFFILLFFISLGSQMALNNIPALLIPACILSFFVLIGNPVILFIIMNLAGFSKKIGLKTGLSIAQISEFSLILATLGTEIGHINQELLSLITLVGLITMTGSTYLMMYDEHIYKVINRWLTFLQFKKTSQKFATQSHPPEAILFGYHRVGQEFVEVFKKQTLSFIVVDYNPESIKKLEEDKIPFRYGDAEDQEFLEELDLSRARIVVSTIPEYRTNLLLVEKINEINKKAVIIVICHDLQHTKALYEAGASYVIMPHYLGAKYATQLISKLETNINNYSEEKDKHLKYLHKHYSNSRV